MRRGGRANRQYDFLLFVIDCIQQGWLVRGEVLVLDNATVHRGSDVLLPLFMILTYAGITMLYLPTYSPELNPCEYMFAICKKWLRYHRRMNHPFWYEIVRGFSNITITHVQNSYNKSIWNP